MKVSDFIKQLEQMPQDSEILLGYKTGTKVWFENGPNKGKNDHSYCLYEPKCEHTDVISCEYNEIPNDYLISITLISSGEIIKGKK